MVRYKRKTTSKSSKGTTEPHRELVASVDSREIRVALLEEGKLTELFIERTAERRVVGNVYKGVVKSVLPGIEAAFIDVGTEKNGFLYVADVTDNLDDFDEDIDEEEEEEEDEGFRPRKRRKRRMRIEDMLKRGQEIMVQVVKEPMGQKGMRLTNYISLPGRSLVLMPTVRHRGVSRKIADEKERDRLRKIAAKICPQGQGVIVRTAGEGKSKEELEADVKYLTGLWQKIIRRMESMPAPSLLHRDLGQVARVVRDMFDEEIDKFVLDSKPDYDTVLNLIENLAPQLKPRVELYRGNVSLFEKYELDGQIEKALHKKVWLPSGGYLVIDQSEALTTIDVNTGKFTGKRKLEDTVFKTNMEAAKEMARQLRLRDIGGIILADFIDMEKATNRQKLLDEVQEAFKADRSKVYVLGMTELGLVQMTRKRVKLSLTPSLCELCPYCEGTGWVKSTTTTMIQMLRQLEKQCKEDGRDSLTLTAHKDVVEKLRISEPEAIAGLEKKSGRKIILNPSTDCHLEFFSITATRSGEVLDTA